MTKLFKTDKIMFDLDILLYMAALQADIIGYSNNYNLKICFSKFMSIIFDAKCISRQWLCCNHINLCILMDMSI